MIVNYHSNNSGGHWWLDDDDWLALEKAGWKVNWYRNRSDNRGKERWLKALATSASREGLSLDAAIEEWERITGQSADSTGCECCGRPHDFEARDENGVMTYR